MGGSDLYTTKAAGTDKKLYRQIDKALESQHESLLRLAASLSPPQAREFAKTSNLSQSSPFGTLSQVSNRRTYAYMIATLNASHPDYDFSHVLRPSDFCREKRINDVMNNVDSKIYAAHSSHVPLGSQTPGGSQMWGPRMWSLINEEMDLFDCEVYSYNPIENPFDDEETALWSLHYFFFNKTLKRVCYLHLRALSPTFPDVEDEDENEDAETEGSGTVTPARMKRKHRQSADFSARKRARYWLGDRADDIEDEWDEEEQIIERISDRESENAEEEGEEEEEAADLKTNQPELSVKPSLKRGRSMSSTTMSEERHERSPSQVRTMNESIAEAIEL